MVISTVANLGQLVTVRGMMDLDIINRLVQFKMLSPSFLVTYIVKISLPINSSKKPYM